MSFIESTTTRGTADKIELSFDYVYIYELYVAMIGKDKWEMEVGCGSCCGWLLDWWEI